MLSLSHRRLPRNSGVVGAIVVTLLLVWRIVVIGSAPLLEAKRTPVSTRALDSLGAPPPEAEWRARLAKNPTDYAALVILAQHLERRQRHDQAADALRAAVALAPADETVLMEAAAFHLRAGDDRTALALLRQAIELNPTAAGATWPIFTVALDSGMQDAFFAEAARSDARWWPAFFIHACRTGRDADALQRVFTVRSAMQVSSGERTCMIERLQRENRWDEAYQSWINSLPPAQRRRIGYVFNGDFDTPPSNLGFDWIINAQDGVNVAVQSIQGSSGPRALRVEFVRKRWTRAPIQQTLMLVPGRYRFEGRGRADGLDTWVGLQWGLHCLRAADSSTRPFAKSESFRGTSDWVAFHDDFTITQACPVQLLRLELADPRPDAGPTETTVARLNGNVWFDDFRVRRFD